MVELNGDERLDYVTSDESMQIIQSKSVFSFSLDAVLLAHFASIPIRKGNILDLCTGNGIVPLLLSRKTNAHITGVEIQERLVSMAERSIELNRKEEEIDIYHGDLRYMGEDLKQSYYDTVTCNPPYFQTEEKQQNKNIHLSIARHEIYGNLEDIIKTCKLYVKPGGKLTMVHRPGRLVDIMTLFRTYHIEPKRIQFVYPKYGREANMLLIEGMRDGKPDLKVLPPLYIYNSDDRYTSEARAIIYE